MTERAERLQALFAAAVELPPERRAEMLARECAGNAQLLAELHALLDADARYHGTTGQPVASALPQLEPALAAHASLSGTRVGAYRLGEEIGHGGMGAVYRAERIDGSVTQQAAIKFMRRELLDPNMLKRFQLERQVMAALNHSCIARLLDAAQLDDGTPYYVMEFVEGVPITEYCERQALGLRERISLMRKVCGAVAAAHRELIVHRDLKPSNILVDKSGNPKLLDFGIAKLLNAPLEGDETGTAYRYFSPNYAAPEQLGGAPVSVACDVYGLGLLLYELLAGCRPFDLAGLSAGQIERLIKDVPPAAPSSAAARAGASSPRARQLRGDLDDIVMRCLRKSPGERYGSVEQLEADLGNYLDGRPVQARGGHAWYRAQKFVWRNKAAVSAAMLTLLSMLFGIVAFAWEARISQHRAAELEQVVQFQFGMFGQLSTLQAGKLLSEDIRKKLDTALRKEGIPDAERVADNEAFANLWRRVNTTDVALDLIDSSILKPAAGAIDQQFEDQPEVDASLRHILADRYGEFGLYDAAVPLLERALATRRRVLGDDDPATLKSLNLLGLILSMQGKTADAEVLLREAVQRRTRVLGPEHKDTLASLNNLCMVFSDQGKWGEAEPCLRDSLEKRRRVLGETQRNTLRGIVNVAGVLSREGKLSEAETYFREALDKRRRFFGENNPETISSLGGLGLVLEEQGRLDEAEPYFREALEKSSRVLGEAHPDTLPSAINMGILLQAQGKLDEAEPYYRQALEKSRRLLGEEHATTLNCAAHLGELLQAQGKLAQAESYYRDALEKRRRLLGEQHQDTLLSISDMGSLWVDEHKPDEAVALLAPVESAMRKEFVGAIAYRLALYLHSLGKARAALGQYADAEANLLEAHSVLVRTPGPIAGEAHGFTQALSDLYGVWQAAEPGKGYDRKALEWQQTVDKFASAPAAPALKSSSAGH